MELLYPITLVWHQQKNPGNITENRDDLHFLFKEEESLQ